MNASRGATRQTRQLSVSLSAASAGAAVVAVEVDADVAVVSCVASSSLMLSLRHDDVLMLVFHTLNAAQSDVSIYLDLCDSLIN